MNNVKYTGKTFEDFREKIRNITKDYYPEILDNLTDASIMSWLIDLNASVADDLSYYTDRMFQETQLDQAQERRSLIAIAKNNGIKTKGKTPSIAQTEWTCVVPVKDEWEKSAPIIKRGTRVGSGNQIFELSENLDFSKQFNSSGMSDRTHTPTYDINGNINGYMVTKTAVVKNNTTQMFKHTVSEVTPFYMIELPSNSVTEVEKIVVSTKGNLTLNDIIKHKGDSETKVWHEVEYMSQNKIFNTYDNNIVESEAFEPVKGRWEKVNDKYIVEYTETGYCQITFGSGYNETQISPIVGDDTYNRMIQILQTESMGNAPKNSQFVYVVYKTGGGVSGNVNVGTITNIINLECEFKDISSSIQRSIRNSIIVTNNTQGLMGRDVLTNEELRNYIRYNSGHQNRCVTLQDYRGKVLSMPQKYGAPYRVAIAEENNSINLSIMALDSEGKLKSEVNNVYRENVKQYLTNFKMINDYIIIKPAKVINIAFEIDIVVSKSQDYNLIIKNVIDEIYDFMDISKYDMGDDIYVSDIYNIVKQVNGIANVVDLKIFNKVGGSYSSNTINQNVIGNDRQIEITNNVLVSDYNSMFEVKYKESDIVVRVKIV